MTFSAPQSAVPHPGPIGVVKSGPYAGPYRDESRGLWAIELGGRAVAWFDLNHYRLAVRVVWEWNHDRELNGAQL